MIPVEDAVRRIAAAFAPLGSEAIALDQAACRVLGEDVAARADQPPADVSAMDGYAVRAADVASVPARLAVVGEAPAGRPFEGKIGAGEAVRIFTGAVVPKGADTIVIQENTTAGPGHVMVTNAERPGRHIRRAGLDFKTGDIRLRKGRRLTARDVALLAAMDVPAVKVVRKPRIAVASTGDELSRPGEKRAPGGIVASTAYGIAAMAARWGGETIDLGILPDRVEAFAKLPEAARRADLVITLGGASVGDHDLVQKALTPLGFALDFWKIAMRPGKPLIFGRLNETPFLGLPGNPVSALVCAILFLRPAIAAMLGEAYAPRTTRMRLAGRLPANDTRRDYIRARIVAKDGALWAEPFGIQDSSMLSALAAADALIARAPHAPAASDGDAIDALLFDDI